MTPRRIAAAIAALLTALILQACLVAPITLPVPVSLPAVLVACVALTAGTSAGISFGFAAGLLADLGSDHPAGVLALCWLGVGVGCGLLAGQLTRLRGTVIAVGIVTGFATVLAGLILTVAGAGGADAWSAVRDCVPAGFGDALLAVVVLPLVRAVLRNEALRAPRMPSPRGESQLPGMRRG